MKVSQSLMKSLLDYLSDKECGFVFKAKYIDGRYDLFPPSDAQNLGAWFEYKATGSIPKNGAVPKARYMKKKNKKGIIPLTAPYALMQRQVDNFKKMMAVNGLEILRVGEDVKALYPDSEERFGFPVWLTGTLDIRALATKDITALYGNKQTGYTRVPVAYKGQQVIVDLKASGLIHDNWSDFGWAQDKIDNLNSKVKLTTQPVHYKYIDMLNRGEEPPFLFMLFSTTNETDAVILDFKVSDTSFEEHKSFIDKTVVNMKTVTKQGFQPLPNFTKCSKCPLASNCEYRATTPPVTVFYFGG